MPNTNMTKTQWVELFRETGLDEAIMRQWHRLFEQRHPAQQAVPRIHRRLLQLVRVGEPRDRGGELGVPQGPLQQRRVVEDAQASAPASPSWALTEAVSDRL